MLLISMRNVSENSYSVSAESKIICSARCRAAQFLLPELHSVTDQVLNMFKKFERYVSHPDQCLNLLFFLFILPSLSKSLKSFRDLVSKSASNLKTKLNYLLLNILFHLRTGNTSLLLFVLLVILVIFIKRDHHYFDDIKSSVVFSPISTSHLNFYQHLEKP